jgi:DNA-binding XRE family transcriptional regulator
VISPSLEVAFRMAVAFAVPLERVFQYESNAATGITLD